MVVTTQDMYFSWVLPGTLAGCRAPWRNAEVEFLREQGILTLVRLQEVERLRVTAETLETFGIQDYNHPIPDGGAPSSEEAHRLVEVIHHSISDGKPVAVSCGGGIGRTGTLLACYLVAQGMTAQQAILTLRGMRSPSIETLGQEAAVYTYEEFLALVSRISPPASS